MSSDSRVTLLELIMSKVSEKNSVTSEETNAFMRIADFLASCFRDKCETVLKLTSAGDAEDEVWLIKANKETNTELESEAGESSLPLVPKITVTS